MSGNPLNTTEVLYRCPVCDSAEIKKEVIRQLSFCSGCRFHFLNPRPGQEEILASYNSGETFETWQKELTERTPLWEKRLKLILRHKNSGRLLDIGTGDGFFLEFASGFFDVDATEISATGIKLARKRGFDPLHGEIEDLQGESGPVYDVITMWHVLEHLPDPGSALKRIWTLLKPGGILFVAVPNECVNLLKAKTRSGKKIRDWPSYHRGKEIHLGYYTPGSLKASLKRPGFQIIDFRVDDVHVWRNTRVLLYYYANVILNSLFRWHAGKAMIGIGKKPEG